MKKYGRILSFLLGIVLLLSLFASCRSGGANQPAENDTTTADPSASDPAATEPKITDIFTADQFLMVVNMINEDETGELSKGVTYRLRANIDLNEGWNGKVSANGDTVEAIPQASAAVWPGIKKFCGTLDGNGKKIRGIYMSETLESNSVMSFITELDGGTIKNLTIENSFFTATVKENAENVLIGGLVGKIGKPSVIENVTVDIDMYFPGNDSVSASGKVADPGTNALTETEFRYIGKIYRGGIIEKVKSIADFSESDAAGTVYAISTAEELETFRTKVNDSADKGKGYVFRLTADIDLNPGWNADPVIDTDSKTVTFPTAPENTWTCINFAGTFDGQGHSISGLYRDFEFGEWGDVGLLFKWLTDNAVVRNLVLTNGFFFGHKPNDATSNRIIGGLASYVNGNNVTIENVYVDVNIWDSGYNSVTMGGVVGRINDNKIGLTINNTVFAGTIGSISTSDATTYPSSSTGAQAGQLIGNANSRPSTCTNVVLCGSIYTASGTWDNIARNNGNASKVLTNIVIGKYATVEAAQTDGKITGYQGETIDMTYSSVAETIVPTSVAGFLSENP